MFIWDSHPYLRAGKAEKGKKELHFFGSNV
jgi:hypothetical protein